MIPFDAFLRMGDFQSCFHHHHPILALINVVQYFLWLCNSELFQQLIDWWIVKAYRYSWYDAGNVFFLFFSKLNVKFCRAFLNCYAVIKFKKMLIIIIFLKYVLKSICFTWNVLEAGLTQFVNGCCCCLPAV